MSFMNLKHIFNCAFVFCLSFGFSTAQNSSEQVNFTSANPFSFSDIIQSLSEQEAQEVFGQLKFPETEQVHGQKHPLIIGVAGSLGWRDHHYDYLQMYRELGFATFELNSFKSRGITSTVGSQDEVTIAAIVLDAFSAMDELAKHPSIDPEQISITGWSLGGGVALFTAWEPLVDVLGKTNQFSSHLAFYPPCFIEPESLNFVEAPIKIMIGEIDDWTPAAPCRDLVDVLSKQTDITIEVFKDAHHGFDSKEEVVFNEKGYSFKNCLFELTQGGDILMNYLKLPMSSPIMQKLGFLFCVKQGVHIGGNPIAREQAMKSARTFMRTQLKTVDVYE